MIEMNIKVTIGLCVKNAANIVKTAFDSISIQDYPHELMKLVIVDDGSSDSTLSLAKKFAQETDIKSSVTSSKGKGLGASRQIVVDNAEGDYIVWVDDDFVLSKDFIRNHVEFMEKNPNVGAARGAPNQIPTRTTIVATLESIGLIALRRGPGNPKAIGAGGAIFRLKVIKKVGGFDAKIKGAGEDQDISHRIRESGWALENNNSAIVYQKFPPATPRDLWKRHFWYGYGNHLIFHKYKDRRLLLECFPPRALLGGFKTSLGVYRATHEKKAFLCGILYFFNSATESIGFIRAHLDGYGHLLGGKGLRAQPTLN
jgi:glycosyltransferase involved in cell wall biosynthesis